MSPSTHTPKDPLAHIDQRVGVFIDTQNLYHSARGLFNARVNYREIITAAVRGRKLVRAFAYVIKSNSGEETKFFEALEDVGIEVRVKDLQIFYGGEKKADWDVGLAMDIVRMVDKMDVCVLMSGDGDFTEVVKYMQSRGVRVEVMAFGKSMSSTLHTEIDAFTDLGSQKRFLIPVKK